MDDNVKTKAEFYAESLVKKLKNGEIKKKVPPCSQDRVDPDSQYAMDLALYKYKRYIGSMQYLLDREATRDLAYTGE